VIELKAAAAVAVAVAG